MAEPSEDPREVARRIRNDERRQPVSAPEPIEVPDYSRVSTTRTGAPYVNWELYKDYVTDDEKVRWSEEGVQKNYDQQVKIEMSRARLAGKPIDEDEALRRVMLKSVGTTVNPSSGDTYLSPTDVKNRQPANSDEVKEYIALNYPSITAAAQQSGLSEAEVLATANVVIARDAAVEIAQSYNPARQAQIFNTMGPDMQGLVGTILQRMYEQGQRQAEITEEQSGGNWVTDTGRIIWGYSLGPTLDFLWDANQYVVNRVIPTTAWALTAAVSGEDPVWAAIETYKATDPNILADPAAIKVAKEQYGDKTIDVILEVMGTKLSNEDDPIGKLYQKYYDAGDFQALEIMDNLLSGTPTDQAVQDAETYLSSSRTGNLGNLMFWSAASWMGVNPLSAEGIRAAQSPFLTGIRDTTNVVGSFLFDPTLGTSKFSGAYRSARYGLHHLSSAKSVEGAFKNRNVRRAFDTFGRSLQYVDDAKDTTIAAQRMNTVNSQWRRFFDADAISAMRQAGVRDADTAYDFFRSAENLSLMLSGQMARRGNKVLIPHMSRAAAEVKLASMKARGLTYDRNSGRRLDELFNAPVSQMLPEESIPYIMQQLGSKDGEKFLGRMLSDFVFGNETAKRTFLGRVFDVMLKRDPGNPRLLRAIDRYGFKREPGARRFIERRGRIMSHMPDVARISITTGKDAYKIRDLLLYGGMPKYWADYSAMVWREMNPGQRMQFATGIGRSVAYARGVDVVDPVRGQRLIDDLTSGFRPGELYAPDMMDLVSLRGMAERLADDVLAGKTKIKESSERKKISSEVADLARSGKVSDEYVFHTTDNLDIIKSGLQRGGISGGPLMEQGYGNVIHVFRKSDFPENVVFGDVTLTPGWQSVTPPKPVASFTYREIGVDPDDLPLGARASELGQEIEPKYLLTPEEIAAIDKLEESTLQKIINEYEQFGSATGKGSSLGIAAARQELDTAKRARQELIDAGVASTDDSFKAIQDQIDNLEEFVKKATVATKDERATLIKEIMDDLKANSPIFNPSKVADQGQDVTRGLYRNQFADQISFINFEKLDEISMRQSYLTALLGNNPFMTSATDLWTLGTLAGPRFQVRNGIEDAIFFGITNGNWKAFRYGQLVSRAKIEATARPEAAEKAAAIEAGTRKVRGGKLGTVPTFTRWIGDHVPKALNGVVLRHLSSEEIALAQKAGREGNRKVLGALIEKAFLRQRLIFLGPKASSNKQYVQDLDDIYDSGYFWGTYDDASEAARHLVDGVLPGADNTTIINGQVVKMATLSRDYKTKVVNATDPDHARAWWNNLSMVLHGDGIKGTKAVSMIGRYHAAKRSGDAAKVRGIVEEYAEWIRENAKWVEERSGIVASEGVESFAQRNLDDVLRLFSTKSGTFNYELMNKVRKVKVDPKTGDEFVSYALWDNVDGKTVYRLQEIDLINLKGKPQSVLDVDGIKIPVTDGIPLNTRIWAMMGRSYARLTRNPMFVANYLDSRELLRPIERRIAQEMGEEYAKKWAVNTATERAYGTLLSYVDNPAVRSQLAFNLRNVARFYRALEDFNRRAIRAVKNYPEGIQKLNLGYRVLDDTGFINEDEFGEKTFVWPGSRYALQTINGVASKFGVNVAFMGNLPVSISSSITNLTPSANPESWAATFSGWYASAAVRPLMRITPGLSSFEEELFGVYGQQQAVWETVLPTNIYRPLTTAVAALQGAENQDGEINRWLTGHGAFASANRTAIQAAAAAGWIDPNKEYTNQELNEIRQRIDRAAMDILLFRATFGPVIPAAFRFQTDSVSSFAKELGVSSMRQAFIQVLRENEGDMDAALLTWMSANPDKSIFTVGTSANARNMGWYEPFKETTQFIDENSEAVEQFPIGASLFAPQVGEQQLSAWNYLRSMGVTVPKESNKYFNEIVTSQGYALYRIYKKQYEDTLATGDAAAIDEAEKSWKDAKSDLNARFPLLDSRLNGELTTVSRFSSKGDYERDVQEYRGAVNWFESKGKLDERGEMAKRVLNYHDEAKTSLSQFSESDPNYNKNRTKIRESWMRMIDDMRSRFPGDDSFEGFLYTTSGSLGFRLNP